MSDDRKRKPPKRRPAPLDHPIYSLGYVIGRIGRNRLPDNDRVCNSGGKPAEFRIFSAIPRIPRPRDVRTELDEDGKVEDTKPVRRHIITYPDDL